MRGQAQLVCLATIITTAQPQLAMPKIVMLAGVIGMILRMAANLQRKVMIHVYTDGGVDPTGSTQNVGGVEKFVWSGDSEVRSAAFVLVYDPNGRPKMNFSDSRTPTVRCLSRQR